MDVQGFKRIFIYHSPQYPGYTCWCGLWNMPDGRTMLSFTQATGPLTARPKAPPDVRERLAWPPIEGRDDYDMTGLDLRNIHLCSADYGETWDTVSDDRFTSCMNGAAGEAEEALPDGTILRGVWGPYLPYDDVPCTGYVQRSRDGSRTWSGPYLICKDDGYMFWPKRLHSLGDGRILVGGGLIRGSAETGTRLSWSQVTTQALFVSGDGGCSWNGPIPVAPKSQENEFFGEEFDFAELANGDLLVVIRAETLPAFDTRDPGQSRLQTRMVKKGGVWAPTVVARAPFPHSGHPELLRIKEGLVLHVATSGVSWTADEGATWTDLDLPASFLGTGGDWPAAHYYPKAVQMPNGEVLCVGHVGYDDGYGRVDQSIVGMKFRMGKHSMS